MKPFVKKRIYCIEIKIAVLKSNQDRDNNLKISEYCFQKDQDRAIQFRRKYFCLQRRCIKIEQNLASILRTL